jgi:hypothetical protein
LKLFSCVGGHLVLPSQPRILNSRLDGGNLWVIPAREVWDRSELNPFELTQWSFLVAAAGRAMLDVLPQLQGGCVNYWEAGNWALHDLADPVGPKTASEFRLVHLNLLGRSRTATDSAWQWGEAPKFPNFVDRHSWAASFERLNARECLNVVTRVESLLKSFYRLSLTQISPWSVCRVCGYPTAEAADPTEPLCAEDHSVSSLRADESND